MISTVRAILLGLLITTVAAFGAAMPETVSWAQRFLAGAGEVEAASPAMKERSHLETKIQTWKRYRDQVLQCGAKRSGDNTACFEQARRERKQTLAEAKKSFTLTPNLVADRRASTD